MDMIELKRMPKEEKKEEKSALCCDSYPMDEYPVGIYLENEQLDQLGISTMKVGDEMEITCKVKVRSFSMSETQNMGEYKSASLSVVAMGFGKQSKSAAQAVYGGE